MEPVATSEGLRAPGPAWAEPSLPASGPVRFPGAPPRRPALTEIAASERASVADASLPSSSAPPPWRRGGLHAPAADGVGTGVRSSLVCQPGSPRPPGIARRSVRQPQQGDVVVVVVGVQQGRAGVRMEPCGPSLGVSRSPETPPEQLGQSVPREQRRRASLGLGPGRGDKPFRVRGEREPPEAGPFPAVLMRLGAPFLLLLLQRRVKSGLPSSCDGLGDCEPPRALGRRAGRFRHQGKPKRDSDCDWNDS